MKLVLIRHGKTAANERRLYCGASDLSLSENGRAALLELRARGGYPDVRELPKITSGMRRTNETLRLLFDAAPDAEMQGLREINFGRFELHSYEELKSDADYQAWISDASGEMPPPDGESAQAFHRRVVAAAESIRKDALIVCHGGVIAALMAHWFPQEERNLYTWQPDFGCGYLVELNGETRRFYTLPLSAKDGQ